MGAKSNIPSEGIPSAITKLFTIKLVDVPTKVTVPPKMAAYERGNKYLLGFSSFCRLIIPIMIATTAVLFKKAEKNDVIEVILNKEK